MPIACAAAARARRPETDCPQRFLAVAPVFPDGVVPSYFHRQADALAGHVHFLHLTLTMSPVLTTSRASLTNLLRQLAHVDQTVLVYAQVHKGAELGHVAHGAFQDHAFLQGR